MSAAHDTGSDSLILDTNSLLTLPKSVAVFRSQPENGNATGGAISAEKEYTLSMVESNTPEAEKSAVDAHDDAMLLAEIGRDAEHGFTLLVKQYTQSVFNLCYSYMGNRTDADDAAQEVFLKIYRYIAGFKRKAKLSTWIYRIAINTCLNALRSRNRRMRHVNADDVEIASHDKSIEDVESEYRIHAAIAKLPKEYRSIVVLREYEHKDYREIAEVLTCSIGSVSSRLSRARDMLRRILSEQEVIV